jgi:two-component system cell cycle sensor histidine kinase/response regulator CckA
MPDLIGALVAGTVVLLVFAVSIIVVMLSSHRKVIEAQQAKLEEVQRSEERYKSLFDNSLAGIVKFSLSDWKIVDSNEALRHLFRCADNEELQGSILNIPQYAREEIQRSLLASGFISEYEIHTDRRDGQDLWLLFSAKITREDHLAQAVIVDITKRKQFEEKIREQGTLLDQTQDAVVVVDGHGIIEYWNSGAELMYGWSRLEVVGRALGALLYSDVQWENCLAAMEDVRLYDEWSGEHHQRRKDGKEILVESRWKRIEKGSVGRLAILIVNSDVTEKRRLESHFIRTQKMESVALLTSGIAHDLQNILAPVAMSIPLLRKKLADESAEPILNTVEESARSGLELVQKILTYARGVSGQRVPLDVIRILEEVLEIFCPGMPESIKLRRHLNGRPCFVSGDHNQLKQVFLNLCVNGRDAMPGGGVLDVSVERRKPDESLLEFFPDAEVGPHVVVSIRDSGKGIAEENLDRIFEPFFTTKGQGAGTGLGLSIAQGIVQSHRGCITVQSAVNEGTTFQVYLPASRE